MFRVHFFFSEVIVILRHRNIFSPIPLWMFSEISENSWPSIRRQSTRLKTGTCTSHAEAPPRYSTGGVRKRKNLLVSGERTHARIALRKSKFDGHFAITRVPEALLPLPVFDSGDPSSSIILALFRMLSQLYVNIYIYIDKRQTASTCATRAHAQTGCAACDDAVF